MKMMAATNDTAGMQAAFESLYRANHRAILTYCARRTSRWDAWDAAAETFVVAWRRLDEVPGGDGARAWLIGVAYKVLANQRRGEHRRSRLFQRTSQATPWAPMPDEQLIRHEEDREVVEALTRLRAVDREIIQLTLWEELAPTEIAIVLGISRDAVDQRFSRAKRRLAHELESGAVGSSSATHPSAMEGGVT